jgi:hypothetical protein
MLGLLLLSLLWQLLMRKLPLKLQACAGYDMLLSLVLQHRSLVLQHRSQQAQHVSNPGGGHANGTKGLYSDLKQQIAGNLYTRAMLIFSVSLLFPPTA